MSHNALGAMGKTSDFLMLSNLLSFWNVLPHVLRPGSQVVQGQFYAAGLVAFS